MKTLAAMLVLVVAAAAVIATGAFARQSAAPTLVGTVGPGFSISLKQNGKAVKTLRHGTYSLVIHDEASIHSFSLTSPSGTKAFTSVPFVGTKTISVVLKAGRYTFFCPPHASFMNGHFTVT